ncbi:zinc finger and SCAN domain-containing protein 29-like [Epinephelus fuscoguttatus]|uniref:zinc finger and SCAN domain-containing protein 29-like n=1 Tax=Epinephelus fuscoguttatus TaxID=293821 RepID=UPI0020D0F1CC|nr:zinc finger and SCAN domain-containing protein 29-like [Epinephelus fuscoguttatus]
MLDTTHKNTEVYKLVSQRMSERGFQRSVEQCRAKAKKLRQQYIKVRDQLARSGSSGDEKDKFPWFDELDNILGTKPVVEPVDVIDTSDATSPSTGSFDAATPNTGTSANTESSCAESADGSVVDAESLDNTLDSTDTEETAVGSRSHTPNPKLHVPGC